MQEYNESNEQEHAFVTHVKELQDVNQKIAKLILRKEELTQIIIGTLEHNHEGQKTYEYDTWKIEVKTPYIFSLDKKKYETGQYALPDAYNPIKESVAYTLDKRLCEKYLNDAPDDIKEKLVALIDKKAGKPNVTIKERV